LVESGVKCRVLNSSLKLHAKVYIFGENCAVITSANLTLNGLDKNIEAGVVLPGATVTKLTNWFDEYWISEAAQPLTMTRIVDLRKRTAALKKKFKHLRSLVSSEFSPTIAHEGSIKVPSTAQFFLCNTDRKHGYEAEKLMCEKNLAAAWENFDFTGHMEQVKQHDLILMYANRAGIIGIGEAKHGCETLPPGTPGRVWEGDTPEWRIPVKWLRWVDAEHASVWKPPLYQTFMDVSSDRYAAQRKQVWKHFNLVVV
jgi:PLD-like domain